MYNEELQSVTVIRTSTACFIVSVLLPTEVANPFAKSLAPAAHIHESSTVSYVIGPEVLVTDCPAICTFTRKNQHTNKRLGGLDKM